MSRPLGVFLHLTLWLTLIPRTVLLNEDSKEECPSKCLCTFTAEGSTYNCTSTGLTSLPKMSTNTKTLILSGNGITQLQSWTGESAPNVAELFINNNRLTTEAISTAIISKIFPNLRELDLSHNLLDSLPQNLPQSLKMLTLSYNKITLRAENKRNQLSNLENLEGLHLDGNMITTITDQMFGHLGLSKSDSHDYILPKLKHLELSNNSINHINEFSFNGLKNLAALSLAYNKISEFSLDTFKGLRNLQYFDASHNELNSIQNQTFKQLSSLKVLYLNHNYLQEVPLGLPFLDWADFSSNVIKYVNETLAKKDIYPIEMLNLAHNPLHCDCHMLWLKELWDRREYMIQDSDDVDSENFIPICDTPSSLHGELWTLLGDDVFVCDKKSKKLLQEHSHDGFIPGSLTGFEEDNFPDVSEFDNIFDKTENKFKSPDEALYENEIGEDNQRKDSVSHENPFIQDYDDMKETEQVTAQKFTLKASNIKSDSVIVSWQGFVSPHVKFLFVRYHVFGHSNVPLFAQTDAKSHQLQLHGLKQSTNYIVCLIIPSHSSGQNVLENVSMNNCIEISTQSSTLLSMLPFHDKTLDYHFKVLSCSFIISFIICGIVFLLHEALSRIISNFRNSSAKKHTE